MKLHKFIRRICAAAVAAALTLSLCTPVLAEGIAALPAAETGGIPIDPAHFPDANFLKYVEKIIDTDHSGTLSQEERNATVIYVLGMGIKDLTGIEFFPELENLDCSENQLTQLDVSKNPKLKRLVCYENKLTSLDVSGNTSLTELHCYTNQLTSLNLGENANLDILNCVVNRLTSLDLSGNANLTRLACSSNLLTSLDVSNNPTLILLDCERNLLTSLNVSKNTELDTLDCSGNKRSLELSDSGRFDLSTLPGFDADRAVWPEGVTVENGILTVPYNTTSLTYRYDVRGNGADDDYKEFVLTFDEVKEPDLPDDSSAPADTGSTAGGAIAAVAVGGAAVWGGYELVTRVMLHSHPGQPRPAGLAGVEHRRPSRTRERPCFCGCDRPGHRQSGPVVRGAGPADPEEGRQL